MITLVCFLLAAAPSKAPTKTDKAFAKLAEKYVDTSFSIAPVSGSYVGYRKYDGQWPDYTEAGVKKSLEALHAIEKDLAKIKPKELSASAAMDLDLIKDDIAANVFLLTELQAFKWDPQLYNEAIGSGF